MSSVPSEIEKLKEKYKTETIRIKNISDIKTFCENEINKKIKK